MTWPMILLAVGSVASGGALAIGGTLEHWLEPVVGSHDEPTHGAPVVGGHDASSWPSSRSASRIAYRMYGMRAGARRRCPPDSALTVAARKDLYGDAFNEAVVHAAGAAGSPRGSSRSTTTRWTGPAAGWPPCVGAHLRPHCGSCRPASPAPMRCRCWPVRRPGGRCDPGGAAVVTSIPWLTVLWAVPMVGAAVVIAAARGRGSASKWLALVISLAVLAVAVAARGRVRSRGRAVPVRRIPQVDTVVRHRLHPRVDGIALALVVLTAVLVPLLMHRGLERRRDDGAGPVASRTPMSH